MNITSYAEKGFLVVKVEGRLDIGNAANFEKSCAAFMEQGAKNMILDFSNLEYISSAGLRSILSTAKKAKGEGGSLALASLSGLVQEVFELSGFDNFLPVFESVQHAVAGGE